MKNKENFYKLLKKKLYKSLVFMIVIVLSLLASTKAFADNSSKEDKINKQIEQLEEKYDNGTISEDKYEKELEKLEKQLEKLQNEDEDSENSGNWWDVLNPLNFVKVIGEAIKNFFLDIFNKLSDATSIDGMFLRNVIYPEKNITILDGIYKNLSRYIKSIAYSIVILYTLWYGFKIYILWKDGNPEESPKELIVRIFIVIALIATSDELLNIASTLMSSIINNILNITSTSGEPDSILDGLLTAFNPIAWIFSIIYYFNYWKLMLGTLKMGIELYVLRLGFPLACINNINSHSNTWSAFVTTLIKNYLGICINVLLMGIGVRIKDSLSGGIMGLLWACAFLSLANNSKELLSQFIISSNNTDGNSAGQALKTITMEAGRRIAQGVATGGAGAGA